MPNGAARGRRGVGHRAHGGIHEGDVSARADALASCTAACVVTIGNPGENGSSSGSTGSSAKKEERFEPKGFPKIGRAPRPGRSAARRPRCDRRDQDARTCGRDLRHRACGAAVVQGPGYLGDQQRDGGGDVPSSRALDDGLDGREGSSTSGRGRHEVRPQLLQRASELAARMSERRREATRRVPRHLDQEVRDGGRMWGSHRRDRGHGPDGRAFFVGKRVYRPFGGGE